MQTRIQIKRFVLVILLEGLGISMLIAQEDFTKVWDLNRCLNYALEHNIQVNKKKLEVRNTQADFIKTKAERLPNLSVSISESLTNSRDFSGNHNGSWSTNNSTSAVLSSNLTLYSGGSIANRIMQSSLDIEIANLDVEATKNSIILSITQAYLNVLYAKESVDYTKEVVVSSQRQVERAIELVKAGTFAKTDLAQLDAQFASDKYAMVIAQNTFISNITGLKQLLEISVTDTFSINFPEINLDKEYNLLPSITDAFNTSLSIMPEIKSSQFNRDEAEISVKVAQSGYLPNLNLNANYSTDYSNLSGKGFSTQFSSNQLQRIGLTLSIPVFNRFATSTSVQKSRINLEQAELTMQETKKNLQQEVENVYQNTIAGKSRYDAATVQLISAEESYKISEEQFNLGMLNSVDLLKAKNTLLSAKKELIQAKYNAILSRKILDFYMGKSISL
jgi:outer membrane protein